MKLFLYAIDEAANAGLLDEMVLLAANELGIKIDVGDMPVKTSNYLSHLNNWTRIEISDGTLLYILYRDGQRRKYFSNGSIGAFISGW
jgi:hypothetical protein